MRRGSGGFTLAELMIVVAIMGMATYIVSLSFDAIVPRERLNTSVRNLTSVLRDARSSAISKGLSFQVEYDLPGRRYRLLTPFLQGGEGIFLEEEFDEDTRAVGGWEIVPPGVEFSELYVAGLPYNGDEPFRVTFDGRGSATEHSIILAQPRYEAITTIDVMALPGLFRMHDGLQIREPVEESDFD